MNKSVFLHELRKELNFLPEKEIEDIIYDYEEHFRIGFEKGKSEEEIASSLGNPQKIARYYKTLNVIENVNDNPTPGNIFKAIIASLSLGFFNLVFVLGPFLGLLGGLIGLFAAAFAIFVSGVALTLAGVFSPFLYFIEGFMFINIPGIPPAALFFLGIGITALGILFFLFDLNLSKRILSWTKKYLNWNIKIIRKGMIKSE